MSSQFHVFAKAVRVRFEELAKEKLFVVNSDRDAIWQAYLAAFPPGTDPMFRQRTEHDCSCCRHFIRDIGNVVAIQNGALASIWDLNGLPSPYHEVADRMSSYVKSLPIRDVFLTDYSTHGTAKSREVKEGKPALEWHHFAIDVPKALLIKRKDQLDTMRGDARTTFAVLMRGVTELKPAAVQTVADLIEENAIYRGAEFKKSVREFQALQLRVHGRHDKADELAVWTMIDSPVARLRNTAIGTLLQDLSEGVDLEKAVKSFETMVAPQNYRRPTALITKRMVEDAMKTIRELDLEPALERRHARLSDVSVSSVLFVDNNVRGKMKDGVEGLLMEAVKPPKFDPAKAEEIGVDEFMANVLPKTTALNLFLEGKHQGNFVSMTAPVHADSKRLFRWPNDFAWSYDGNVTDSIKERVKRAGGQVEGVAMRVSLAWSNYDDLDLHVWGPRAEHYYFANKGNILDVDMNAGGPQTRQPVENMRWPRTPDDGRYTFQVHNYRKRENSDVGFEIEIETPAGLVHLRHDKAVPDQNQVDVCTIVVSHGGYYEVEPAAGMVGGLRSQEKWGLKTLEQVRVNSVVLSPNHWNGNAAGNKHWFFILEGCKNPEPARGIYNEFLAGALEKHRKVFEVLGDKTKCPVVDDQLSGVGFSSTRKDKVTVVAMGPSLSKAYTIVF